MQKGTGAQLYNQYRREYNIWGLMKQRCTNPKAANYVNYGAKGVSFSDEFKTFSGFFSAMGPIPSKKHTLDRIDNNKGYCPENCRWADVETQQNNRTNGAHYTAFGETLSAPQWARKTGIAEFNITHRIKTMGMSPEDALRCPKMSWRQRPVVQKTLDGHDVQRFGSIAEAAKHIADCPEQVPRIRQRLWERLKSQRPYLGHLWAYIEQAA